MPLQAIFSVTTVLSFIVPDTLLFVTYLLRPDFLDVWRRCVCGFAAGHGRLKNAGKEKRKYIKQLNKVKPALALW